MVSLLRARADLPGGRAALCAFADRPTTQRVNIFTSPSEKKSPRSPGQTVHASASSKLVYLLLICLWRGRGLGMPRSPSVPAPPAKSFIWPFTHCLPTRLSETKNDCGGTRRGRSWGVREPRHPEREQRAAKVECESRTQHMPI